jgi:small-conductance mechanosensitive channel
MELKAAWATLAQNFTLTNLVIRAAYIICIALAFEFIAWWAARLIEKQVTPLITSDAERDAAWRIRRRTILRHTPKLFSRTVLYALALILVFEIFGVPVLPLSLTVGAATLLFGAALLPVLRDFGQGYTLLAEDALAPGDAVDIDGHQGVVEKFTLRGVQLRDKDGRAHLISNRDISNIVVYQRKVQTAKDLNDPLASRNPNKS